MQLSSIWSNGMIIQRNKSIYISGYATGNHVTITFANKLYQTPVSTNCFFELTLDPLQAGGPYEMILYDGDKTVISDIWIGDVWVLGGQSNMELPIRRTLEYSKQELQDIPPTHPIRMFQVPQQYNFTTPLNSYASGSWSTVNHSTIMNCSAVGYFFARELYLSQDIPIGLIHTAVGGTPVEAWMSEETLTTLGIFKTELQTLKLDDYITQTLENDQNRINAWNTTLYQEDLGLQEKWYATTWNTSNKNLISIPKLWFNTPLKKHLGSVWLQKEVIIPASWLSKEITLSLGTLIERDEVYVNGILVGHTGYQYPPRNYLIPPNLLKEGSNQITIRIVTDKSFGGTIPGKCYALKLGNTNISLEGDWAYRIGATMEALNSQTFFQYKPSGVFNSMIAPLRQFGITGIAFYQGESNTDYPYHYKKLFTHMIQDWRTIFAQGNIPFLYVQLANYGDGELINSGYNWSILREQQRACLSLPNVAMIVSCDVGEYNDLHPQDKITIGKRLALAARCIAYKEDLVSNGPTLEKCEIDDTTLKIFFTDCGKELVTHNSHTVGMMILWSDNTQEYCELKKEQNHLLLKLKQDQWPIRIRYGWGNNPEDLSLYNSYDLPASPFEIYWDKECKQYVF